MSTSIRNLAGAGLAISSLLFPSSSFGDSSSVVVKDANDEAEDTRDFLGKTFGGSGGDPVEVCDRIGGSQVMPQKLRYVIKAGRKNQQNQGGTKKRAPNGHAQEMDTATTILRPPDTVIGVAGTPDSAELIKKMVAAMEVPWTRNTHSYQREFRTKQRPEDCRESAGHL